MPFTPKHVQYTHAIRYWCLCVLAQLGEGAGMLSGGQRQRLAIARSIISDPKVLLLDEATSALDPQAESIVQRALKRASQGRTVLVIAHKLSTIKDADNIAVITNGCVGEQGTHEQLIAQDGQYAALVRVQDLGHDKETSVDASQEEDESGIEGFSEQMFLNKTVSVSRAVEPESQENARANTRLSFLRYIFRLLKEQKSLYSWFIFAMIGILAGGTTYPGQALLLARLINVFAQPGATVRSDTNSSL